MKTTFIAGDRVAYKTHPHICIGTVSPDIKHGLNTSLIFDDKEITLIPVFTSDAWAKHFGHGVCPNTLNIESDRLMLYKDDTEDTITDDIIHIALNTAATLLTHFN